MQSQVGTHFRQPERRASYFVDVAIGLFSAIQAGDEFPTRFAAMIENEARQPVSLPAVAIMKEVSRNSLKLLLFETPPSPSRLQRSTCGVYRSECLAAPKDAKKLRRLEFRPAGVSPVGHRATVTALRRSGAERFVRREQFER